MNIPTEHSHLDHLIRQTRAHHVQLSTMADMKANILLTASSLVMTLAIRYVSDPLLKWSALTLIAFSILTAVLSIYAVMPHLPLESVHNRKVDPSNPKVNLLFFGDFAGMAYDDYEAAMEELMGTPERAYEAQVREVFLLGNFLATKKYRLLRLAYTAMLVGFVSTGLVLVASEVVGA